MKDQAAEIPVIDISPWLGTGSKTRREAAGEIRKACRAHGFFYVSQHGVDADLLEDLESLSREFFARPLDEKMQIAMERGGRAWRGYFPVGDELTRGLPDQKEGVYFGAELEADHPKVRANYPLHGPNLFPDSRAPWTEAFKTTVLRYIDALTELGHGVMRGLAESLGLDAEHFRDGLTADPLVLFRIFNYPSLANAERLESSDGSPELWSVGEHTDYGLLTLLLQDKNGGLQVKSGGTWIEAPPIPGTLVCNLGDMLDKLTGGFYKSTPHRVRNRSDRDRLSFPFFFDPGFETKVLPIDPRREAIDDAEGRWDGANVHDFQGTYGDYLLSKVAKVFPALGEDLL